MKSVAYRSILLSVLMITSSLAGCLGDEAEDADDSEQIVDPITVFGSVMVSTYHVGELVKAVAGEHVEMHYMSQDNIPVHDYEPSAADLIRLQEADVFFYHGLNLEPWVDSALESLGADAPASFMTHTMMDGEVTLDFESLLVSNLCELMNDGPFESTTLATMSDDHDDHDDVDHGDDDHGDDDHGDDDHGDDDHDDDGGMQTMTGHGDHSEDDDDHDDHDDHGDDHSDDEDDHGDEMCHNTDTHENYESTEEDCEAAGHMWTGHEDHDLPEIHADRVAHTLSFPIHIAGDWVDEWGAEHSIDSDSWNDNTITHYDNHGMWAVAQNSEDDAFSPGLWSKYDWTWQSEELYYCQSTFGADTEADALSAESANASDLEAGCGGFPWSLMEEAGHDDHHDMVCYDMNTHTVDSTITTEEDCDAAGLMWTAANSGPDDDDHGDDDHGDDDHSDEEGDHDDHGDEDHGDEDHHEIGAVIIHIEEEGDYGFAMPSDIEFYVIMGEGGHDDHDDHGDEHDDHSDEEGGHDDHGDEIEADEGEEAFDYDPHSWLDPLSFNEQLKLVQDKLTMTFPDGTEAFAENTEAYSAQLTQLHDRFEVALGDQGTCVTGGFDKTIVANHNAYSYISVRYDIDILTVHGLDPEGEPSPAEVAEVVEHIKEEGITVLFVEEYTDQSAVQSIVEETGVEVQILYTMEMRPSDNTDHYLSMMNKNIVNIVTGIGC